MKTLLINLLCNILLLQSCNKENTQIPNNHEQRITSGT